MSADSQPQSGPESDGDDDSSGETADVLELDGKEFHVVEFDGEYRIAEPQDVAVDQMKASVNGETDADDVNIYTIAHTPDDQEQDWTIGGVSWADIALSILASDDDE